MTNYYYPCPRCNRSDDMYSESDNYVPEYMSAMDDYMEDYNDDYYDLDELEYDNPNVEAIDNLEDPRRMGVTAQSDIETSQYRRNPQFRGGFVDEPYGRRGRRYPRRRYRYFQPRYRRYYRPRWYFYSQPYYQPYYYPYGYQYYYY